MGVVQDIVLIYLYIVYLLQLVHVAVRYHHLSVRIVWSHFFAVMIRNEAEASISVSAFWVCDGVGGLRFSGQRPLKEEAALDVDDKCRDILSHILRRYFR
jgi:hypothetical protein